MNVYLRCCWCDDDAVNVLGGWSVCEVHRTALKKLLDSGQDITLALELEDTHGET